MLHVLGLGDNVCDVYLHTNTMYPGGQALNFSVYAAALGAAADFMGVFGTDTVAEHIRKTLTKKGVGFSRCRIYEGENGFARVTLKEGDRVFMGSNRGGVIQRHPIFLTEEDLAYASGFDLIHTTNNGFLDDLLPKLPALQNPSGHPAWISYDFSGRWTEEDRILRVCPWIDFGFLSASSLSDDEVEALCRKMQSLGTRVITVTRGSRGAVTFDGRRFYRQAPDYVEPVDTLGAGDSFATAMLVCLAESLLAEGGLNPSERMLPAEQLERHLPGALKAAAAFSAKTCLVKGAFGEGIPVPENMKKRIFAEVL